MHQWHDLPEQRDETSLLQQWTHIRAVRAEVQKQLEEVRVSGAIGSSLQAEVDVHSSAETHALLAPLGDDLRLVLITSQARLHAAAEDSIVVTPSTHPKCERCWHYRADVDAAPEHSGLCGRCVSNLYGSGEVRQHA